jgi:hypothetical protein
MNEAPPEQIVCVDCGGDCHLITYLSPDQQLEPGSILTYRCQDCLDRWDVVWDEPQDPEHA